MSLRLLRPRLGQLLVVGCVGTSVPVELRALAREFGIGGLLLSRRNIVDALQVEEMTREAKDLCRDVPPWVALHPDAGDGGVPPLEPWPPLATLGRADDAELTRAFAEALAQQHLALGLTLAFEPRLGLAANGEAGAAFGSDPDLVSRHALVVLAAMHAAGVAPCASAFPGVADSRDRVNGYPLADVPPDHLAAVSWVPFRAAIGAGAPAMVVRHVVIPALDEAQPIAQSSAVLQDVLRGTLGFGGAIVTDDLDALSPDAAGEGLPPSVRALAAGCDVLVQGGGDVDRVAATLEHIVFALEREDLRLLRVESALRRHETLKAAYLSRAARRGRPASPSLARVLDGREQARIADRMRAFL